jgi:hypothetical protein
VAEREVIITIEDVALAWGKDTEMLALAAQRQ